MAWGKTGVILRLPPPETRSDRCRRQAARSRRRTFVDPPKAKFGQTGRSSCRTVSTSCLSPNDPGKPANLVGSTLGSKESRELRHHHLERPSIRRPSHSLCVERVLLGAALRRARTAGHREAYTVASGVRGERDRAFISVSSTGAPSIRCRREATYHLCWSSGRQGSVALGPPGSYGELDLFSENRKTHYYDLTRRQRHSPDLGVAICASLRWRPRSRSGHTKRSGRPCLRTDMDRVRSNVLTTYSLKPPSSGAGRTL